jgi:hypothetical protein
VAGTEEARHAVFEAHVPQTAVIPRRGKPLRVEYEGAPEFAAIPGTELAYALNTASSVFRLGDAYYCCAEAVWYESKKPTGTWKVCVEVPEEIYRIPPTCPHYIARFVFVYGATPDEVYVGYTQGYLGSYVLGPTLVYGTGYDYEGWTGSGAYLAPPATWGYAPFYDVDEGTWLFRLGFWWEESGEDGTAARKVVRRNVYRWRERTDAADSRSRAARNAREEADKAPSRERLVTRGPSDDIYAGPDGYVYRRSAEGWQRREGEAWSAPRNPEAERKRQELLRRNQQMKMQFDLDRQYDARRGAEYFARGRALAESAPGDDPYSSGSRYYGPSYYGPRFHYYAR